MRASTALTSNKKILMRVRRRSFWPPRSDVVIVLLVSFLFCFTPNLFSAPEGPPQEPQVNFLFRDTFYASPALKLKYDVYESNGFLLVRDSKRGSNTEFSVVTGFSDPVLESRILKNIRSIEDASTFLEKNTRKIFFERIPIKELPLIGKSGTLQPQFWIGQRAFHSLDKAKAKIVEVKSAVETNGGNFDRSLELITEFFPEEPAPTPQAVHANYLAEEELALKILDWLDVGEKNYGALSLVPGHLIGTAPGEPMLWQSFGESTFRWTNLDRAGFNDQVGYWTNRIVFKGLRFIGEPTLDPYVEVTAALESQGANFPSHLDLVGGLEYRPFSRVNFFENFNYGGFYLLKFVRNYRFYVQYLERKNLTDEITGSPDTDLWAGVDIFYEWGVDLPLPWVVPDRDRISEWIHDFVWGEYYGNYNWRDTNFSSVDGYHAWVYNSSLTLGIKWPTIPLPKNPINDQLTLMPYVRFEHITVPRRSELSFDNRIFVAAGIRWMPFRSYQFEHNEWLFKTKLFAEYVGVGGVHHPGGANPADVPNRDWRAGINVSFKRY
ncbi:MAG: hypothetical protein HY351_03750 [Candidatus Omnitrophica bacterium]|nr:hypothetical protein [Candidatus Omnitrophota bacterium]